MRRAPRTELLSIAGPAGALECVVEEPITDAEDREPGPQRFAIACHPHPLYGGTLANKVVHTLARTFQELGIATLRFNFRGVGHSAGSHDEGRGETDDALAIVEWGRRSWPGRELWLAGFSFGAYVAARAAARARPQRLVTIAPPVARFDFATLPAPDCPWLIVQGDADELVDVGDVRAWVAARAPAPDLLVLPGVDHFFHGRLHELRTALLAALAA
ncbi:MAG: alpha/beta fold hydrolase [Steroidobacteraceae bacterium]